jgi:hypothetical protein
MRGLYYTPSQAVQVSLAAVMISSHDSHGHGNSIQESTSLSTRGMTQHTYPDLADDCQASTVQGGCPIRRGGVKHD